MAKRIGQSAVNWTALAERVPADQRVSFAAFKARSDSYLRRVLANPPEPPKINWQAYKATVPVAGMVENFEKQYSSLQITFPQDTLSSQVDAQWTEVKKAIDAFVQTSNANIAKYEKDIAETKALLPYEQMTLEDYRDAFPDEALDPINKPSFWPHNPEEQLDYKNPDQPAAGGH